MICPYKTVFIEANGIVLNENHEIAHNFIDFAAKIKDKYELVLISESPVVKGFDDNYYFDYQIFGENSGCKKPSIEFFDFALERIGRKPAECILIDCDIKSLLFAEEVGIATLFFNRNGENFDGMAVCSFNELIDIIG